MKIFAALVVLMVLSVSAYGQEKAVPKPSVVQPPTAHQNVQVVRQGPIARFHARRATHHAFLSLPRAGKGCASCGR